TRRGRNDDMLFSLLCCAWLEARPAEIWCCTAGHNPPYRLKGGQLAEIDEPRGIILGVQPEAVHATGRLTLAPGETIFLFTDGVTEANNRASELFSESRLEIVLRRAN